MQFLVDFNRFAQWWKQKTEERRRSMLRKAKKLFRMVDEDDSGSLDRGEVMGLSIQLLKMFKSDIVLDPPFDIDQDWPAMDPMGTGQVSFTQFVQWWKSRTGTPPEISTCAHRRTKVH